MGNLSEQDRFPVAVPAMGAAREMLASMRAGVGLAAQFVDFAARCDPAWPRWAIVVVMCDSIPTLRMLM